MTSIPESPRDQFLFFIDNPIVAGEPGGQALIKGFLELVAPLVGSHGAASSAMAALFDHELFSAAPVESGPSGENHDDKGGGHHDASAALDMALGLFGSFARGGELDL